MPNCSNWNFQLQIVMNSDEQQWWKWTSSSFLLSMLSVVFFFYNFVILNKKHGVMTGRYSMCMLSCFSHVWLWNPMDHSLPDSSVHGIIQTRLLEWVAMLFSRGSSNPGIKPTSVKSPALAGGFLTASTTWEACTALLTFKEHSFSYPWGLVVALEKRIHKECSLTARDPSATQPSQLLVLY